MVNIHSLPNHIVLQWHITERCNLQCAHCYQDANLEDELLFQDMLAVVEQFKDLLDQLSRLKQQPVRGHINITGGEPFVREDFLELINVFYANRNQFSFAILTNGYFIDEAVASQLRKLNPAFVQVSIEGSQETNDKIRGPGAFNQSVSALKYLVRERINSAISFTAHKANYREFPEVAKIGMRLGVSRVWADRLIPWGIGSNMREQVLSQDETREFIEIMYKAHNEAARHFCTTEISMNRALQFLVGGGTPYECHAGDTLVALQSNGDLYPCRRMPITVGNLLETSLTELYHKNKLFHSLRDRKRISEGCEECSFSSQCRGGLKCLSYALTGDPFKKDPGCWHVLTKRKDAVCENVLTKSI